ncbi:MAG: ribose 5-phosphate isomerase B [candidate division Zixibacteria bacterium HGW-Zixibacteria-1]|nr:MAG: ribose 5-phosphate isomerase B [candidate division Zixibacteria bacterium HGW-Zixibacteria-1]
MTIAIGSDHAGFELKERVKSILTQLGHGVVDFGTGGNDSVDYTDYGLRVARAVAGGEVDRGIAVCWTGNGMTIIANKVKGIRATLCLNKDMAYYARLHNDSNVLTMSQKYTDLNDVEDILKTWLGTEFEGGRHERRLNKIKDAEEN